MPPQPSIFDFYQELEVERTASLELVISSYRRLARVHHPDRNFGKEEEATIKFQRLQQAYETLSDPAKRDRYDDSPTNKDEDQGDYYDYDDDGSREFFPYCFGFGSGGIPGCFQEGYSRGPSWWDDFERKMDHREQRAREHEAEYWERYRERRDERRRGMNQQYAWRCQREEELEAERELSRAAKQAAEDDIVAAKELLKKEERLAQEQRWEDMNAVSKYERLRTCLHSDHCAKVEQKKKFKCAACSAKRGIIAFECPHCSIFLCQLCVRNFSTRRQKLPKARESVPARARKSSNFDGLTTATDANDAPIPDPKPACTQQPSFQEKKNKTKKSGGKGKSAPGAPTAARADSLPSISPAETADPDSSADDEAESPTTEASEYLSTCRVFFVSDDCGSQAPQKPDNPIKGDQNLDELTAKPIPPKQKDGKGSKRGRRNWDVHSSTKDSGMDVDQPGGNRAPTATQPFGTSDEASFAENTENIILLTKENVRPALGMGSSTDSSTAKLTGKKTQSAPRATSTQAFVRTTKPKQGFTAQLLRPVMDSFGAVASLSVNKAKGTAHVAFADYETLCRAVTASPVAINPQISVKVAPLKVCGACGKMGHTTEVCRTVC